jgi:hypothetical protein
VSLPEPQPGLVIRYSYLWRREASKGVEDGRKDRPCVIVAAVERDASGKITVVVLPVTHSEPAAGDSAIELPQPVKLRLLLTKQDRGFCSAKAMRLFGQDRICARNRAARSKQSLMDFFHRVCLELSGLALSSCRMRAAYTQSSEQNKF